VQKRIELILEGKRVNAENVTLKHSDR